MARVDLITVHQGDSKWVYGCFDIDEIFGIAREVTGAAGINYGIRIRWTLAVNIINRKMI